MILPGEPGRRAATATPGQTLAPARRQNAADVRFAEQMITHHRAALAMTALVSGRTTTPQVVAAAARIQATQGPEITWLSTWLSTWLQKLGRRVPHGHAHDLEELRASKGRLFDRLFLTGMIEHHEGALDLAERVLGEGEDPGIARLAADIEASQSAEIARMRAVLLTA